MVDTISATEAMQALKDQFGPRLNENHEGGRRVMAEVIQEHFGVSADEAREVVKDLEAAHSIRWVESGPGPVASPSTSTPMGGTLTGQGAPDVPLAADTNGGGYWQLER